MQDGQPGTIEIFSGDGGWRDSQRITVANTGGHGTVTPDGYFLAPEESEDGLISVYRITRQTETPEFIPVEVTAEEGQRQPIEDHPLLAQTELLRARSEGFPRSSDIIFSTGEGTIWLDQRRGTLAVVDTLGGVHDWAPLPDLMVEERIGLFRGLAEEGRVSPLTFFRQVASSPRDRAFLPMAGPQDEVIGWALQSADGKWDLQPVAPPEASTLLPVEAGLWIDESTLLVGYGSGGGVGVLEMP